MYKLIIIAIMAAGTDGGAHVAIHESKFIVKEACVKAAEQLTFSSRDSTFRTGLHSYSFCIYDEGENND